MEENYKYITTDFINIFKNNNEYDYNDIIKKILYTNTSPWILKQYLINKKYENIEEIIDINVKELLSKFTKNDLISYIINNLKTKFLQFKSIDKNIIKVDEAKQNLKNSNIKKMIITKHERNLLKHINIYDIFNE